jgi:hypothetical protein
MVRVRLAGTWGSGIRRPMTNPFKESFDFSPLPSITSTTESGSKVRDQRQLVAINVANEVLQCAHTGIVSVCCPGC